MSFACHGCGECCRKVDIALRNMLALPNCSPLHKAAIAFPYKPLPDGSCPQLLPDNRCAVYADRPLLCDVDRLYDALPAGLSREAWYELNAAGCPPAAAINRGTAVMLNSTHNG